jgi:Protein of unknown function (DUF3180)
VVTTPLASTRLRDLAGYAVASALVVWLALRQWYGDLPRLSWFLPLSLGLLAAAEAIAGGQLRARIRRRPGIRPVQPLVAARSLALAKASAVVGAVMLGVWAGLLLYVLPRLDYLAAADGDARTGSIGVVAATSLVAAALWLEWCCRTPSPPDDEGKVGPNGSTV